MQSYQHEEEIDITLHQETVAQEELAEEGASLQQQRSRLDDQRALLDLQRIELEQQLAELELQYAILDAHYVRLDRLEQILASEYETVKMIGKRRF